MSKYIRIGNQMVNLAYLIKYKTMNMESDREKALALVNAYFDGKDIIMKDPIHGVPDWVSVRHPEYWSYLTMFCKSIDKYKIVEECQEVNQNQENK